MHTSFGLLPATFRSTYEQAKGQIAEAVTVLDSQPGNERDRPLLHRVAEATRELQGLAPELAGECLRFAIALESNLGALLQQKVGEGQLTQRYADDMLTPWRSALRQFHFTGEMALRLDYFREHYLSAAEDSELRKTLQEQGAEVEQAIERLLNHVVSEVLFEAPERTALCQAAQALARFRNAAPKAGGLTKDDVTVRRRQFIRVVGLLCLRLYGHCTTDQMARLLELKAAHYLLADDDEDDEMLASEKAINRELGRLPMQAKARARSENWETAPLVLAFFSRAQWKAWEPPGYAGSRTMGFVNEARVLHPTDD